ncbi:hypothetical protein [Pedobacter sp. NJ-S-72]
MLTDALFQALFETPSPRLLLNAVDSDYKIICDNHAFKLASYNTAVSNIGKNIWDVFKTENTDADNLTLLRNSLIQSAEHKQKVYLHDFKYCTPVSGKTVKYWDLEITPVGAKDDHFQYVILTIQRQKDKKDIEHQHHPELSSVISHIPVALCILSGREMILEV